MIQVVETHATLAEAQRAMGPDAIFMAGGTLVMREVNAGATATRIVRSTDPALADIRLVRRRRHDRRGRHHGDDRSPS